MKNNIQLPASYVVLHLLLLVMLGFVSYFRFGEFQAVSAAATLTLALFLPYIGSCCLPLMSSSACTLLVIGIIMMFNPGILLWFIATAVCYAYARIWGRYTFSQALYITMLFFFLMLAFYAVIYVIFSIFSLFTNDPNFE